MFKTSRREFVTRGLAAAVLSAATSSTFAQFVIWEPPSLNTQNPPLFGTQKLKPINSKEHKLERLVNTYKPRNLLLYRPDKNINSKAIEIAITVYNQGSRTSSVYNILIEYDVQNRPYLMTIAMKPFAEVNETGEVDKKSWIIMDDVGLMGRCSYGYVPPSLNDGVEKVFDEHTNQGLEHRDEFNKILDKSLDLIIKTYEQ